MTTALNHADGTGISKERYHRLLEIEECLNGLVDPVDAATSELHGQTIFEKWPTPRDRFDIWTQIRYVVDQLKTITATCDEAYGQLNQDDPISLAARVSLLRQKPVVDGQGTSGTKSEDRLKEAEECLDGLVKPITDTLKAVQGFYQPDVSYPGDKFGIWSQMNYIEANIKDIAGICADNLVHDQDYTNWTLPGKVRLLVRAMKSRGVDTTVSKPADDGSTKKPNGVPESTPTTTETVPPEGSGNLQDLSEAKECLNGLLPQIKRAKIAAQGGTIFTPHAPEGRYDIWYTMQFIVQQLETISTACDPLVTDVALEKAALGERASRLIAANKRRDEELYDNKNCLDRIVPMIEKAHKIVDGGLKINEPPMNGNDPDVVNEMSYVVNELDLVNEALNSFKVDEYKTAKWEDLSLEWRVRAIAGSKGAVPVVNGVGEGPGEGPSEGGVSAKLAEQIQTALITLDVDAIERRQSPAKQMQRVLKELQTIKNELKDAGGASPNWYEESLATQVHVVVNRGGGDLEHQVELVLERLEKELDAEKDGAFKDKVVELMKKILPEAMAAIDDANAAPETTRSRSRSR